MNFIKRLFRKKKDNYDVDDWIYDSIRRNTQKLNTIIRNDDRFIDLHDKEIQYSPISRQLYYKDKNNKTVVIGVWNVGVGIEIHRL